MPGSIRLSVLEWMETTPRGSISTFHSIKVSVGKNEYQSVGREDFSFPVTSIRDNLVIMLFDSDGNLVTKKELKTISVAEKGDAEIVFPLEFGGDLKLRLSFILSEEEKEKIREMRSSVLKRKHEELIKGNNVILSSGTSIQLANKDYSKLSNQKIPKISTESNRHKNEEHGLPRITKEKKKISFFTVSQSVDDLMGTDNKRSGPNRTPSHNIKKMISAFENNDKQNLGTQISPRTRARVNKFDSQTSIESMSYENEDIKQRRISQTLIRRSFSAGSLAEAILQDDPNFADTPNENLTSSFDEMVGVNTENKGTNLLPRSAVRNQQKGGLSNKVFDGILISASYEKVKSNMGNREMNFLQRSVVRNQQKKGGFSNKAFDGDIFHRTHHCQGYGVPKYINELSCIDRTSYFFEISDVLKPRHLCLTSAPKKVRHFIEKFTASSSHNEKINFHGIPSDKVQGEIVNTSQTDGPHRQKVGSSIFGGWLIEQGARIFIVIVACGTIILNTR